MAIDSDLPLLTKGGSIWDGGDIWNAFKKYKKFIINILTPLWMDSLTKHGGEPQVPSGKNFEDICHKVQGKSGETEAMERLGNRLKTKAYRFDPWVRVPVCEALSRGSNGSLSRYLSTPHPDYYPASITPQ